MAEGWPLPFGHTAVSVLRRITVTLSFLLPHFRRTHTHTHRLSPSLTGSPSYRHTHRHTHIHRQLRRQSHIWLMASCDLSDPFLSVYCGPTWPGLSGQRCRPRPRLRLRPDCRCRRWLGKRWSEGGSKGGMRAGNVAKNVHLFSEVLLFVLTRVAVNCGKHEAKCLEYL